MEEKCNIYLKLKIYFFFAVWNPVGPCATSTPGGKGFVKEQLSYDGNSTVLEERKSECNVDPVEGRS